jgi:hypothetical protein
MRYSCKRLARLTASIARYQSTPLPTGLSGAAELRARSWHLLCGHGGCGRGFVQNPVMDGEQGQFQTV